MNIVDTTIADFIGLLLVLYLASIFKTSKTKRMHLRPGTFNIENEITSAALDIKNCERLSQNLGIIFDQFERIDYLQRIDNTASCFNSQIFLSKVLDFATARRDEEVIERVLIPITMRQHPNKIQFMFFICCQNKFYRSVLDLLESNIEISYDGKNILHLAALFDDLTLATSVSFEVAFLLHQRDSSGRLPFHYVKSQKLLEFMHQRMKTDESLSPHLDELNFYFKYVPMRVEQGKMVINFKKLLIYNREANISIKSILKDSYKAARKSSPDWFKTTFCINFMVVLNGENEFDVSGVRNKWMSLLLESFFKPNPHGNAQEFTAPLFKLIDDESSFYVPTNICPKHVYKFAGTVLFHAMQRRIPIRAKLIPAFYNTMYGLKLVNFDDLKFVAPQIHKNLELLLENSTRAEIARNALNLNFEDAQKYIDDYADNILYERYRDSLKSMAKSFKKYFADSILEQIDPFELKENLEGVE